MRRLWTEEEDYTLRDLVRQHGDLRGPNGRWKEIASALSDRTAKDCRKRWFLSLDPSLRKGRWTESEDRVLMEGYARMGPAWHDIALLIPGRKDDQCAKRYTAILDPKASERLKDWSPREDQILQAGVQTLGHRWSAIAASLPGRPPLTCRNRWRKISKRVTRNLPGQQVVSESEQSGSFTDNAEPITPSMPPSGQLRSPPPSHATCSDLEGRNENNLLENSTTQTFAPLNPIPQEPPFPDPSLPDETSAPALSPTLLTDYEMPIPSSSEPPCTELIPEIDFSTIESNSVIQTQYQNLWNTVAGSGNSEFDPFMSSLMGAGGAEDGGGGGMFGTQSQMPPYQIVHHHHHHHHHHYYYYHSSRNS